MSSHYCRQFLINFIEQYNNFEPLKPSFENKTFSKLAERFIAVFYGYEYFVVKYGSGVYDCFMVGFAIPVFYGFMTLTHEFGFH